MILLVQADFERLQRVWLYKLVHASPASPPPPPAPTRKSILSLYVSTVDRIIHLDQELVQKAVKLAAKYDSRPKDDIIAALEKAKKPGIVPRGRPAKTATHILENLVARMHHHPQTDDRVGVDRDALEVLNFLDQWFKSQPEDRQEEQPGGASAIIAQMLTQLGEPNVVLWTGYHSRNQARVFDQSVKFLVIDEQDHFDPQSIGDVGRSEDPEIRNYSIEFAKDTEFELERSDGTKVSIRAASSDRVIAISPGYRFFKQNGDVRVDIVPPDIAHILTPDPQQGPSYAARVAQDYKHWIIGGLHYVSDGVDQQTLAEDLQQLRSLDVMIHVEIPKQNISRWFQQILRQYVRSVGVNVQDIEGVVQAVANNTPLHTNPPKLSSGFKEEYFLELAFWLACELDLERLYIHGLELDYVVRRKDVSDDRMGQEMSQEIHADLLAKTVVANRARGVSVVSQLPDPFGLSARNLVAYIKVCFLRAYPTPQDWVTLEDLPAFKPTLDQGWFKDTIVYQGQQSNFWVAIIPVALFRLAPDGLKFVGAGDTTSAISFVFGYHNPVGS